MIITREYIEQFKTRNGAWTQPQLEAIGVSWPPKKGWKDRVTGKDITPYQQEIFESKMTIKQFRKQYPHISDYMRLKGNDL